jgi:hypothetical protein
MKRPGDWRRLVYIPVFPVIFVISGWQKARCDLPIKPSQAVLCGSM